MQKILVHLRVNFKIKIGISLIVIHGLPDYPIPPDTACNIPYWAGTSTKHKFGSV